MQDDDAAIDNDATIDDPRAAPTDDVKRTRAYTIGGKSFVLTEHDNGEFTALVADAEGHHEIRMSRGEVRRFAHFIRS